jgi:hypothetical protein
MRLSAAKSGWLGNVELILHEGHFAGLLATDAMKYAWNN